MLSYTFMQHALIAGLFIATTAAFVGSFIVLRRYSLIAETVAHAALLGVAVALFTQSQPLYMSIIFALLSSWIIEWLRMRFNLYSDAILSIFLSGSLALAVLVISKAHTSGSSLFSYLFGSILSISSLELYLIAGVSSVSILLLALFRRQLYFVAFNEEIAKSSGLNVTFYNFLLISIASLMVALSLRIVGSLLIGALLVMPVLSALQFAFSFSKTILLALFISIVAVLTGLSLSYYYDLPSGAAIVVVLLIIFIISLLSRRD